MGSNKGNGRGQEPKRRRGVEGQRRRGLSGLDFEFLEARTLLDAGAPVSLRWHATTDNVSDVQNGPLANAGQELIGVYQAFQQSGDGSQVAKQFPAIRIVGD